MTALGELFDTWAMVVGRHSVPFGEVRRTSSASRRAWHSTAPRLRKEAAEEAML
jgi:hypothetical protein